MNRVFVSDCEGPISKNDNAFELTADFVPEGDKVFALISIYDDVLADVVKRRGYNAGDTLKLILPFLKAFDVTDAKMQRFSNQNLVFIAGSRETLSHIRSVAEAFIVSTSYEHYIRALCETLGFPFENTYCTRLRIDKYALDKEEKGKLQEIAAEIAAMPMITIPSGAKSLLDFSERDRATVARLDEIFWTEISAMPIGKIFSEVITVGGRQKAEAILEIVAKRKIAVSDVMYVGDSITDVEAFQLLREGGGLAVSFNGNGYAVRNAEVAVQSESNMVTAVLADVFLKQGKARALRIVAKWSRGVLKKSGIDAGLLRRFFALYPDALPKVQIVTPENMKLLSRESSEFRKKVRGESIGKLG